MSLSGKTFFHPAVKLFEVFLPALPAELIVITVGLIMNKNGSAFFVFKFQFVGDSGSIGCTAGRACFALVGFIAHHKHPG